ncbi:MAG: M1 family aminopeptidase, partial [Bacteroidota bacterium]
HEVGHNWFYGILGSNERDHAWMDEGLNSFYETRTMLATDPDGASAVISLGGKGINNLLGLNDFSYSYLAEELPYLLNARRAKDQPIDFGSDDYTSMNYGAIVYKKTALAFKYLMGYLGEDLFDRCMHEYYNQWKFRHPYPKDLKEVFEQTSGKNLSWFFDEVIKTTGRVDYAASSVRSNRTEGLKLKVRNRGDIAAPFSVDVLRNGTRVSTSWLEGCLPGTSVSNVIPAQKGDVIVINNADGINEYYKRDNRIRTTGIFRKTEPVKLGLLTGFDNPDRTQCFLLPMVGWNNYNRTMYGLYLGNQTIPRKHFKWSVAQMFSPAVKGMSGFNSIGWDNGYWGISSTYKKFNLTTLKLGGEDIYRSYAVSNMSIRKSLFSGLHRKDLQGEFKFTVFGLFNSSGDQSGFLVASNRFRSLGNWTTHYRLSATATEKFALA